MLSLSLSHPSVHTHSLSLLFSDTPLFPPSQRNADFLQVGIQPTQAQAWKGKGRSGGTDSKGALRIIEGDNIISIIRGQQLHDEKEEERELSSSARTLSRVMNPSTANNSNQWHKALLVAGHVPGHVTAIDIPGARRLPRIGADNLCQVVASSRGRLLPRSRSILVFPLIVSSQRDLGSSQARHSGTPTQFTRRLATSDGIVTRLALVSPNHAHSRPRLFAFAPADASDSALPPLSLCNPCGIPTAYGLTRIWLHTVSSPLCRFVPWVFRPRHIAIPSLSHRPYHLFISRCQDRHSPAPVVLSHPQDAVGYRAGHRAIIGGLLFFRMCRVTARVVRIHPALALKSNVFGTFGLSPASRGITAISVISLNFPRRRTLFAIDLDTFSLSPLVSFIPARLRLSPPWTAVDTKSPTPSQLEDRPRVLAPRAVFVPQHSVSIASPISTTPLNMSGSPHPFSLPRPRRSIVMRHTVSALLCSGFSFLRLSPFDCLTRSFPRFAFRFPMSPVLLTTLLLHYIASYFHLGSFVASGLFCI
ncbi:hypothetical protein EDB86DRAFT_3245650 [Lactarius hatsudake]|nr:hypothetical protein EDB86DRAFT_3245650 [Lactarius hatsudake]